MVFSSISFLYYFLPIVLILYFLAPRKFKNSVLLLTSLVFYFYGEPIYCLLLIFSSFSGYLHGILINQYKGTKYAKILLISSIVISIGLLMFFKYSDFLISNINAVFQSNFSLLGLVLPLGISFYTFQILSYTIDVYRGEVNVQRNPFHFATYVTLFPQLIAGPIVRYKTIEEELNHRNQSFSDISYGIGRFIIGLSKKVLIANTLAEIGAIFSALNSQTVLFHWMIAFAFMLQIYFDFSGYSDMAIGLGRIFGFHFLENFNYPYISKSITEFWRRWHISLGSWFRNYVYIPLGGNRVSYMKWIRNILIVWFLTGFWHGAAWNFIIWGLMFAILLLFEKMILKEHINKIPNLIRHFYVLFVVLIGFVVLNAEGIKEAFVNIKGMFGLLDIPLVNIESVYYLKSYAVIYLIAIIGSTPMMINLIKVIKSHWMGERIFDIIEPIMYIILLLIVTGFLVDGSFNPFLYFRF